MPRRLPTVALSVGFALVLFAAFGSARGDNVVPAAATDDGIKIHIEPVNGAAVEGTLKMPAVTLQTDTDVRTIEWKHIRRVTFQMDPAGTAQDSVQMADKSVVRGRVVQDSFVVKTADGEKTFSRTEVREMRPVRDEKVSLLTILLGLLTLTAMEIVLGVDNVIFLTIVTSKLPPDQRPKARRFGLAAALGTRLLLLFFLSFILGLTKPVLTLPELGFLHDMEAREVSWRDIILLAGGLFLIGKSVLEVHKSIEHAKEEFGEQPAPPEPATGATAAAPPSAADAAAKRAAFVKTILTIAVIDIVFSLDSVITAVGMVEHLWVMVVAMVIAMGVMLWFAGPIGRFVETHPTLKILALSFLILIGVMLVAEGLGQHVDKGYIYFAMAFAVAVEMVNMRLRKGRAKKPA